MEQGQPMLHSDMAATLADRMVELIVGRRRPERLHISQAETPDGLGGELELGDRNQIERTQLIGGALALGIEAADQFQRIPEEVEPHRLGHAGRIEIDDAAAHRVVASLTHGGGAGKAVEFEPARDALHVEHVAGGDGERLGSDEITRRHPLERGIDGRQQHGGMVAALQAREPRQRRHPLRHHAGVGRRAVIGQAIPGREFQHRERRIEEAERARERRHARSVAAHHQQAGGRRIGARRDRAGEIGDDQPLRAVGDARERQRAPGLQEIGEIGEIGRGLRHPTRRLPD